MVPPYLWSAWRAPVRLQQALRPLSFPWLSAHLQSARRCSAQAAVLSRADAVITVTWALAETIRRAYRLAEGGYDLARRHTHEARAARLLEVFQRVAPGALTEARQSQPRGGGL